jgi:tetratricopeptide (TPR) repeat protein
MSAEQAIRHPDAETIAALAEGRLDASKLDVTLEHVESCRSCMDGLTLATATISREGVSQTSSRSYVWWMAAAAALVAFAIGAPFLWDRGARLKTPAIADLVELAPRNARLVEPRLSGGFAWAPYRGEMRAESTKDPQRLRIGNVAADAIEKANRDATASTQHVAGVAMLLADDSFDAVERLSIASARAPDDARIASDLAAARYAAALSSGRASLYPEALAAADHALRVDARFAEALFNRALILERLGLAQEARRAWERYLAVDPSSEWAVEARRRAAGLPATTSDATFRNELLPQLERAATNGDAATVARIVQQYPQQSRTFAEAEHLGRWGEATLRADTNEATRLLGIARAIGTSMKSESLLRDAVLAIDRAEATQRLSLARAHQTYRRGRMAYARQQLADAERDIEASVSAFESGASPMAYVARYFVACVLYDRTEVPRARVALEDLARATGAHDDYVALRAQTFWQLALCAIYDNDWTETATLLAEAETLFARSGERANLAFVRVLLANALMSNGKPDEAWTMRIRAFESLSAEGRGDRLLVGLGAAGRMEQRVGRLDTARALLSVEIDAARNASNQFILPDALVRSAVLAEEQGDHDAAVRLVREASVAAARISDESLRKLAAANVTATDGVVELRDDPRRAIQSLTRAIDFYGQMKLPVFLPGPHLYRARAALRQGRTDAAMGDLESGIAEVERQSVSLSGAIDAAPVFDVADALFEDAIRLSFERGDRAKAFEYAERRRAQFAFGMAAHPPTLSDLQRRLRGSGTLVLHLTSLPEEVIAFAIAENDFGVTRSPFARNRIEHASPAELFEILIRPSSAMIDKATDLIVVADPQLERVSFAALYDGQRKIHLIERISVAMATSAAALVSAEASVPRAIVAVALPAGEHEDTRALPGALNEINEIAPLYPQARILQQGNATFAAVHSALQHDGVLHLAGHTTRDGDDTALRLAGGERATWTKIAASPLNRRNIIVLAACETLRGSTSPHVRSLSLGAAFVAAGAESVIGTLTPIPDAEAQPLFLSIHRQLAAGVWPAEAVRRAQLEALANGRLPSWKSIAIFTRCIRTAHPKGASPWVRSSSSSSDSAFTSTRKTFPRYQPNIA